MLIVMMLFPKIVPSWIALISPVFALSTGVQRFWSIWVKIWVRVWWHVASCWRHISVFLSLLKSSLLLLHKIIPSFLFNFHRSHHGLLLILKLLFS